MGECFLYRRGGGSGGGAPVLPEVEKTVFGRSLVLTDSTSKPLKGLRLFGRTTQNGTPSPDNPVPLVSPGDGGSITVEMGASNGVQNIQRLVCNTPNGLPGIPVSSGGNMADENGQQWVCDEIDFARGKYVQRVRSFSTDDDIFNYADDMSIYGALKDFVAHYRLLFNNAGLMQYGALICNCLPSMDTSWDRKVPCCEITSTGGIDVTIPYELLGITKDSDNSARMSAMRNWLAENVLEFVALLATPIETDLTAEELAQYAALHTNSLYTTISNTGGADMEVTYIAIGG